MKRFKTVEDMPLGDAVNYALDVLNFVDNNADEDYIRAAVIDAAYVIEKLQMRLVYGEGEEDGNQNHDR